MIYLQPDNTIDVVSEHTLNDYQLFFGPTTSLPLITNSTNLGEILVELNLSPSKGWSRKNGWWKEISPGFQQVTFGKNKVTIYLFLRYKDEHTA